MTLREQVNVVYATLTANMGPDEEAAFARRLDMTVEQINAEEQEEQRQRDHADQQAALGVMGGPIG